MLTGKEIERRLGDSIIIDPYTANQLNPNSYNLSLHNTLLIYTSDVLDPKENNEVQEVTIPEDGYVLVPGQLYLARTVEYTETHGLVPMIVGRSSLGRLGLTVHITSGFGDIGFCGHWTMQLTCVKRIRIYPNMHICQIYYQEVLGEYANYSSSKYQGSTQIIPSKMYMELNK